MAALREGEWAQAKVELPPALQDVGDKINSVADLLLSLLNILLTVTEVSKMFSLAFINPMEALVEALISEIRVLLEDLRQAGVYFSGDFQVVVPFDNIRGGYAAYERRMVARLVDKTDPTRPNFQPGSQVFCLFLYTSTEVPNEVVEYLKKLIQIANLFNTDVSLSGYTTPVNVQVKYGLEGDNIGAFASTIDVLTGQDPLNRASLKWQMSPIPGKQPYIELPLPGPAGFLIEVSTLPDGIHLCYEAPPKNAASQNGEQRTTTGVVVGDDGKPFVLFGGSEQLDLGDNPTTASGRRVGGSWVYGVRNASDMSPIPVGALKQGDKYLLQRTFYVKSGFFSSTQAMNPGKGFSTILNYEDMPYDATFTADGAVSWVSDTPARNVYVRIVPVSKQVTSTTDWKYAFVPDVGVAVSSGKTVRLSGKLNVADRGSPSLVTPITFPGPEVKTFLDTVTVALAVMALGRCDVPVESDLLGPIQPGVAQTPTGVESVAVTLMPHLLPKAVFKSATQNPVGFRKLLLGRCRIVASLVYDKLGAIPALHQYVNEQGSTLRAFKWSDINTQYSDETILQSLDSQDTTLGVGANPESIGLTAQQTQIYYTLNGGVDPTPGFYLMARGQSSVPDAPVIYAAPFGQGPFGQVTFVRNALLGHADGVLFQEASAVLNAVSGPLTSVKADGQWFAYRLLPDGLPGLEEVLDTVLLWAEAIASSVRAATQVLVDYINYLETRILELQSLINRINGFIQSFLDTIEVLVEFDALMLMSSGTDGVVRDLLTATNKPTDSDAAYGMGVVLVGGGGLPASTTVVELLTGLVTRQE